MMRRVVLAGLCVVLGLPLVGRSQTLADVARAEEARRKTVKQPAKVYTNDDLKPAGDLPPAPGSTESTTTPAATESAVAAAVPAAGATEEKKDEKFWKSRITQARETLEHDKVLADALQSRINALTADFVNTADPVQRAAVQTNRNSAVAELDRLNKDIQLQTKAISDIQEEARKAGVPPGWLR